MTDNRPLNMLIAGVGGQGVFTLTRVIWRICAETGRQCHGSTFKGGAQTLGSIYSILRVFPKHRRRPIFCSTQMLPGDLDLMIGLEPWETLRHSKYFGSHTTIYLNTSVRPLLINRYRAPENRDPCQMVEEYGLPLVARDFTSEATKEFGSWKMANYAMGREMAHAGVLPFQAQEFTRIFADSVRLEPRIKDLLMVSKTIDPRF